MNVWIEIQNYLKLVFHFGETLPNQQINLNNFSFEFRIKFIPNLFINIHNMEDFKQSIFIDSFEIKNGTKINSFSFSLHEEHQIFKFKEIYSSLEYQKIFFNKR